MTDHRIYYLQMSSYRFLVVGIIWCLTGYELTALNILSTPRQDPCQGIECWDGWVCSAVDIPVCELSYWDIGVCEPTPVCLPAPKVGECPEKSRKEEMSSCDNMICYQDDNCPGDQKCCLTSDCGRICLDAVDAHPDRSHFLS